MLRKFLRHKYINNHSYSFFEKCMDATHLLIAGSTGSGKSTILNGIIHECLLHSKPMLILCDPKRVEFSKFKKCNQVLKYANDVESIYKALEWACMIMEDRYKKMERKGLVMSPERPIYIIIDEYADLMLTDKKRTEKAIQRLLQLGRAAGIHCILATQIPLAEILSTKIKANCTDIIGLRVPTRNQSRVIIGTGGCESLPKYGECLWLSSEGLKRHEIVPVMETDMFNSLKYNEKTFILR